MAIRECLMPCRLHPLCGAVCYGSRHLFATCITRLPATYSGCEHVIGEAVARNRWEEGGVLAQSPLTQHRPGTFYKVAEDVVPLYGKPYRAAVVHSGRARINAGTSAWRGSSRRPIRHWKRPCARRLGRSMPVWQMLRLPQPKCGRYRAPITACRGSSRSAPSMALDGPTRHGPMWSKRCGMACRSPGTSAWR
jgi:hypothetical protein